MGCFICVDGTDCRIEEPFSRSTKRYSHKINSPGLRYEVDLTFRNRTIVWIDEHFACGSSSDIAIFTIIKKCTTKYIMRCCRQSLLRF